MPSAGAQLPAQPEKRKHDSDGSSDEDDYGPALPTVPQKRKSPSPSSSPKRPRMMGPTLPPANLDEKPPNPPSDEDESSDEDDGFGPALPSSTDQKTTYSASSLPKPSFAVAAQPTPKVQRDEWMVVPPSSGDWSSRVDPTKIKSRTFNTGKSARGPSQGSGDVSAKWTETPAEKAARLQREMMGIQETTGPKSQPREDPRADVAAQRVKERIDKSRGGSLYAEHQKSKPSEEADDPSARAFDREKDIAGGSQINNTQRRELLKKASDFSTRFNSAKYL